VADKQTVTMCRGKLTSIDRNVVTVAVWLLSAADLQSFLIQ